MYVADSPSEADIARSPSLASLRGRGGISIAFRVNAGATRLADLEECGGWRAKFPRGDIGAEVVLINTGGGLLGGDRCQFQIDLAADAQATVATQSAERVYRALDAPTELITKLNVGCNAGLAWLPQPTILFNAARLVRRTEGDVAASGSLLLCEAIIFGRAASGEVMRDGSLQDRWRIRRDGQLIYAEDTRLAGDMASHLQRVAVGNGAGAIATVIYVAPDAEDRRDATRQALGKPNGRAAVSAWNGMLVGRFVAAESAALRADLIRVVTHLSGAAMPRVWNC